MVPPDAIISASGKRLPPERKMSITDTAASIAANYNGDFLEIVCEGKTITGETIALVVFAHDTADDVVPYIASVWANDPNQTYWSVPLLSEIKRVPGIA